MVSATATATWLSLNTPFAVSAPFRDGWSLFYEFSRERDADYGSLWQPLGLRGGDPWLLNLLAPGALLAGCLAIAWVTLRASRTPSVLELTLLTVAAFLLTGKVWSPQFMLWLLPVVLIVFWRRPPVIGAWQVVELAYFVAVFWHIARVPTPLPTGAAVFLTVGWARWLAVAVIALLVAIACLRRDEPPEVDGLPATSTHAGPRSKSSAYYACLP